MKFYRCEKCGKIVCLVKETPAEMACCSETMKELADKIRKLGFRPGLWMPLYGTGDLTQGFTACGTLELTDGAFEMAIPDCMDGSKSSYETATMVFLFELVTAVTPIALPS